MVRYASDYTIDELMIARMAKELKGERLVRGDQTCAGIAVQLAKRTHAPDLAVISWHGFTDRPVFPGVTLSEFCPTEGSIAIIDYMEVFDALNDGRWLLWMSSAQMDAYGNTNISAIGDDWKRPKVALIGSRGIPDNTVNLEAIYYYVPSQNRRTFVEKVDFVSGVGFNQARDRGDVRWGQPALVVSNLGVYDFDPATHRMRIASLHPNVSLEQVISNTGFELVVPAQIPETMPPTQEEVDLIRNELDPLGTRKLEFLGPAEAAALRQDIVNRERAFLREFRASH